MTTLKKVLFVCHGNVCRSAMAQAIFRKIVKERGLENEIAVDSAATSTEEIGNPPHPEVRKLLDQKQISYDGQYSRQIESSDFQKYDLIIGMDYENMNNLLHWAPKDQAHKIHLCLDVIDGLQGKEIADPWYTGNFDLTFEQINEAMPKWIDYVLNM